MCDTAVILPQTFSVHSWLNPQLEKNGYGGSLYHAHYVITYSSLYS